MKAFLLRRQHAEQGVTCVTIYNAPRDTWYHYWPLFLAVFVFRCRNSCWETRLVRSTWSLATTAVCPVDFTPCSACCRLNKNAFIYMALEAIPEDPICRTVLQRILAGLGPQRILAGLGNASRTTLHKTIKTYPPEEHSTADSRPSHETGHVRDHAKGHVPCGSNWR